MCGPARKILRGFVRNVHIEGELRERKKSFEKALLIYSLAIKIVRMGAVAVEEHIKSQNCPQATYPSSDIRTG